MEGTNDNINERYGGRPVIDFEYFDEFDDGLTGMHILYVDNEIKYMSNVLGHCIKHAKEIGIDVNELVIL